MLTCNNLIKTFGSTTACHIDALTVNDGEILGVVGNNGAGKTTLFRLILDLLKSDEGEVALNGINPAKSEDWKDFTGAYIDEGFLINYLTPAEYFNFVGKICGIPSDEMTARVEAYRHFLTSETLDTKKLIRNLSAGNKQKVGIVSVLTREPGIVLLDEPFNYLDPSGQIQLKHLLTDYNQRTGATIIVSSHNLQHTAEISSRIILLEHGNIVQDLDARQPEAIAQMNEYFES